MIRYFFLRQKLQVICPLWKIFSVRFATFCWSFALFCSLFPCTWFQLKTIVKKYLLPQVGSLIAVGTGYWMLCFTIKKEKWPLTWCTDMWWVQTCCVLIYWCYFVFIMGRLFFFLASGWKIPLSCPAVVFWSLSRPLQRKNGTLNTGNTNLLVNHAEKQIMLHNHKRSCTKGPLYCITTPATCIIKTLATHYFSIVAQTQGGM